MSEEERKAAAAAMGRAKSEKKTAANRESIQEALKVRWTPERRKAHSEKMKAVWAKRAQAAEASGYVGTETAMGLVEGDKEE